MIKTYPAKLLLFGEHTVLVGSSSLAIPLSQYSMRWITHQDGHQTWLSEYAEYLRSHCSDFLNITQLNDHLSTHGIDANIPIGYGMGSSGSLTAAIFDVCGKQDLPLSQLQTQLGKMESFFHGQSSGFDPLISFIQKPILKKDGALHVVEKISIPTDTHIYLLDSQRPRQGKDMISQFLEFENGHSAEIQQLSLLNNKAVDISLGQSGNLLSTVKEISSSQLAHLSFMIIPELQSLWQQGLHSDEYYMKVCGAGGGGYYLVFSLDPDLSLTGHTVQKVNLSD